MDFKFFYICILYSKAEMELIMLLSVLLGLVYNLDEKVRWGS